ncbi:xanthine dehydrogenase family protein subunit M [Kibdelosporangium persicum]|uniref:Xanthine dehydrogenase YagS FAD-binding subunit n=1 Tax=Kibdelosporangium persicum TaxID=2698649 RepID=A0ABX2F2N0_9PSEU|nr:xanthine dehydrogenase family protein subunit M [Kibdelosporangium persicum]NRN65255.1 Xanthine dehydrogenase YagS FAD-binding subunit [Kibdelosporangium persicum]
MRTFDYTSPRTVDEAVRLLADHPGADVIAGGTDLVTLLRDGIRTPTHLVDVNGLGLDEVSWQPGGAVRIGALCRNAIDDPALGRAYPVLVKALRAGASPQIRNRATFGGNLLQSVRCPYFRLPEFACNRRTPGAGCAALHGDSRHHAIFGTSENCIAVHPSDCAVALLALDAHVLVQSTRGTRRIPVAELHRLPGRTPHEEHALRRDELITAVELPAGPFGAHSTYVKARDRASFAFALASAAAVVAVRGGVVRRSRICLGGVAPKPWRSTAAEEALRGRPLDDAVIEAAADAATRDAQTRPDNAYKVDLVHGVVRQALTELREQS